MKDEKCTNDISNGLTSSESVKVLQFQAISYKYCNLGRKDLVFILRIWDDSIFLKTRGWTSGGTRLTGSWSWAWSASIFHVLVNAERKYYTEFRRMLCVKGFPQKLGNAIPWLFQASISDFPWPFLWSRFAQFFRRNLLLDNFGNHHIPWLYFEHKSG